MGPALIALQQLAGTVLLTAALDSPETLER